MIAGFVDYLVVGELVIRSCYTRERQAYRLNPGNVHGLQPAALYLQGF